MNETTPQARRRPSKRSVIIASVIAGPAVAGALLLSGAAHASSDAASDAPQSGQDQTVITATAKDDGSGATITLPDGTTQKLPDGATSGWISVGPDGKVQQGTGALPKDLEKKFEATAPAGKDSGITITKPDGTTENLPAGSTSGWISVGPDGKVTQGTGDAPRS